VGTGTPRRDHDHAHTQPAPAPAPITNGNAANITNEAVAQHQPIPPEPGARPYDPEERPALGDRTVKELEAENSPFTFVRTQAVTQRAHTALERTHHQPARSTRDDRPHSRPRRGRGDRQEAERER